MLRVDLHCAKPGMRLALPVYHPHHPNHLLLKVGHTFTDETLGKLRALGLRTLWVRYPSLDFLSKYISADALRTHGRIFHQITTTFEQLQDRASAKIPYHAYCQSVGDLVGQLIGNPQSALFLGDLAGAAGDGLFRHSSTVTYLSLLMGLKLEGYLVRQRRHIDPARAKDVINIGVGAMLHDLGVTQLPADVRERYLKTGDESDPAWREHPALGYATVRGKVEPSAATIVLNHHQRFDGSGYAGADVPVLDGTRIHVFARVVGLAEQFDRLRNPAPTGPEAVPRQDAAAPPGPPTVRVLRMLLDKTRARKFDPEVMAALFTVTPPYPPGSTVRLSDGRWAVCLDHHGHDPCRPTVQIIPDPRTLGADDLPAGETIDLSQAPPALHVAQSEGQDVTRDNFQRPHPLGAMVVAGAGA